MFPITAAQFRLPVPARFLAALIFAGQLAAAETYRGFTIDESAVRKAPNLAAVVAATREQIDIVHDVGLPAAILAFAESIKFELVPEGTFRSPTPGIYTGRGEGTVKVSTAIAASGHKPVLLHELMHAYHDQRIEKGFRNPAILGFYRKAETLGAYAARSHMMSNEKEFFACGATAYLFGVTAQEPFNREKVAHAQPDFSAYLKNLFGPDAGTHAGALTR